MRSPIWALSIITSGYPELPYSPSSAVHFKQAKKTTSFNWWLIQEPILISFKWNLIYFLKISLQKVCTENVDWFAYPLHDTVLTPQPNDWNAFHGRIIKIMGISFRVTVILWESWTSSKSFPCQPVFCSSFAVSLGPEKPEGTLRREPPPVPLTQCCHSHAWNQHFLKWLCDSDQTGKTHPCRFLNCSHSSVWKLVTQLLLCLLSPPLR